MKMGYFWMSIIEIRRPLSHVEQYYNEKISQSWVSLKGAFNVNLSIPTKALA